MSEFTAADRTDQGLRGTVTAVEPDRLARSVARRSAESRATVPTVEYSAVADISAALPLIAAHGSVTPLLVRAAASALRLHPRANGAYRDGRYEQYGAINIGVTLAEGETYVTPTLLDADTKSEAELAAEIAAYLELTRSGELHPSALAGATFTVLAATGDEVTVTSPIVAGGQAATLGAGPVRSVPVLRDGAVVVGHTLELILAADHRILYGAAATAFLQEVKVQLEGITV